MSLVSGSSIGPLRSQMSGSSGKSCPPSSTACPPSPYLDVMSVRNTHVPKDGIEETRRLIFDPVLIPDLEHTGVRPTMDLEDRLLFYPSGCKNCNLQLNIHSTLQNVSGASGGQEDDTGLAAAGGGGRGLSGSNRAGGKSGGRLKVQKQPPNKVTLAPCAKPAGGEGSSSVLVSNHSHHGSISAASSSMGMGGGKGLTSTMLFGAVGKSPPRPHQLSQQPPPGMVEGRYDLNGVKTLRKKPTSDKAAKTLVKSLQSTAHQMSLLVFNEV